MFFDSMKKINLFLFLVGYLSCAGSAATQTIGGQIVSGPLLPQVVPSVAYPSEAGYTVTSVAGGANLQTALTAAACGTVLSLAHGGTFTAGATPYTLPNNTCACHTDPTKWVIIRSDSYVGGSTRGARIDPSVEYASLAHITGSDANYLFGVTGPSPTASCYWFGPGLDLTETHTGANALIAWGDGNFTVANFPHDLMIDHSYLHGLPTFNLFRAAMLNGNWEAVVDSYISDCHFVGFDSQGLESFDGFGGVLYQNNFIEGAAENTMFGGSQSQPTSFTADITIQKNHYFKPLAWRIGDPTYVGIHWPVKNSIEFKTAQRVLVTSNVFDTSWSDGQPELTIFNTGCSDSAPSVNFVQDVTEYLNWYRHGPQGVVFGGCSSTQVTLAPHRFSFSNNLWTDIDSCVWGGCGSNRAVQMDPGRGALPYPPFAIFDIWQAHETFAASNMSFGYLFTGVGAFDISYGMVFKDSIITDGANGAFGGQAISSGDPVITNYAPNANFKNNCMYGSSGASYAFSNWSGRQHPANQAAIFVTPGSDYHVAASSVCHLAASDGLDMGANVDAVLAATSGVVQPLANLHTVTNVSPSTFTHLGGTGITITGTNFLAESGLGVIVGGAGPAVAETSNSCGFSTPGQFVVSTSTDTTHFKYSADACTVVTSTPITLAVNDTVNVTVNSALTGGNVNRYSLGNACTSVSVVSPTSITCTTPAATGTVTNGPVSVFVSQFGIPVQSTVYGNYN